MQRLFSFFSLFTSLSTLVCCALPALFVSIGMGATLVGLTSAVPGLVWISEHKNEVFLAAAAFLSLNGLWLWKQRNAPCPLEANLRDACLKGRQISRRVYGLSVIVFLIGFYFAYAAVYVSAITR